MDKLQDLQRDIRRSMKLIRDLDTEYGAHRDLSDSIVSRLQGMAAANDDNNNDLPAQREDREQLAKSMSIMYSRRVNSLAEAGYAAQLVDNIYNDLQQELNYLKKFQQDHLAELPDHHHPKVITQEPRYCICNDVYYGEMIACDNPNCLIEWYHLGCVGLKKVPKGSWYCPTCKESREKGRKGRSVR